jgi:hypothetical protein
VQAYVDAFKSIQVMLAKDKHPMNAKIYHPFQWTMIFGASIGHL